MHPFFDDDLEWSEGAGLVGVCDAGKKPHHVLASYCAFSVISFGLIAGVFSLLYTTYGVSGLICSAVGNILAVLYFSTRK